MSTVFEQFKEDQKRKVIPDIRPGDTVRVHERVTEAKGERIQIFEGLIIARKHGKELGATFTVRKISSGIGVERTFPLHSPLVAKIEIIKRSKVRRAKLYYMRKRSGRAARMRGTERSDVFDMSEADKESAKREGGAEETDEPVVPEDHVAEPGSAEEATEDAMKEPEPDDNEDAVEAPKDNSHSTDEDGEPSNDENGEEGKQNEENTESEKTAKE